MAENDATRKQRHRLAPAVKEYRESLYKGPSNEHEIARNVSDKWVVPMKDVRAQAESGA